MSADRPPAPPNGLSRGLPLPLGKPFWVYVLLGLIAAVFALEQIFPAIGPQLIPGSRAADFAGGSTNNNVLVLLGANFRPLVLQGQVWRFFTAMFLHIGFQHLLFNAYALFIFGAEMERVFGRLRFLVIYILSGLFGSLISFALHTSPLFLSAGASGAIFGVIGMQLAYFIKYKTLLGEFGRSRLMNVAFIVGLNVLWGFSQPGIDNLAHLGGLAAGVLLAYGLAPVYQLLDAFTEHPRVVNRADFRLQLWIPLLAVGLLVAGTLAAIGLA